MADVFLNFPASPAGYIRGDIEYDLENLLGDRGRIAGGGAEVGNPGFNIDLELSSDDREEVDRIREELEAYLRSLPAPHGTTLIVIVGEGTAEHYAIGPDDGGSAIRQEETWENAVIGQRDGRIARVTWHAGRRLPAELVPVALQLGYSESELNNYDIGELTEDLNVGDEVYRRGSLVLPDEKGLPASLFGRPLLRKPGE
jgi:hypothetical protein